MSVPAFTPAAPPPPSSASTGATGAGAQASQGDASSTGFDTVLAAVSGQNADAAAPPPRAAASRDTGKAGDATKGGKSAADGDKAKVASDSDAATDTAATTNAAGATPDAVLAMLLPTASTTVPVTGTGPQGDANASGGAAAASTGLPAKDASAGGPVANAVMAKLFGDAASAGAAAQGAQPPGAGGVADVATAAAKAQNAAQNANQNAATASTTAPAKAAGANVTAPAPATPAAAPAPPATPPAATDVQAPPVATDAATAAANATAAQTAAATQAPQPKTDATPATGAKDKTEVTKTERVEGAQADAAPNVNTSAKAANALQPASNGGGGKSGPDNRNPGAAPPDVQTDAGAPTNTPAGLNTAANAAPASLTHAANTEVRATPQTVATLAAQIANKLDGRSSRFDVQLDPAGLGKVNVRIEIGSDGRMSASMSFDNPHAAAELKARAGELQRTLEQSGFDLSGGLSFDVSGGSGQGRQAQGDDTNSGAAFRGRAFQAAIDTTADVVPASQAMFRQSSASGVDIRI